MSNLIIGVVSASTVLDASSATGHPIWRIQFISNDSSTWSGLYEVTMNGETPTGGTATANDFSASIRDPSKAVDGSETTHWQVAKGGAWWQYEFSGNVDLTEITITTGPTLGSRFNAPSEFNLQFSDDGVIFETKQNYSDISWMAGQTRTFTVTA